MLKCENCKRKFYEEDLIDESPAITASLRGTLQCPSCGNIGSVGWLNGFDEL